MRRLLLALAFVLAAAPAFAQTATPTATVTANNLATPTATAPMATPIAPAVNADPHAVVHARGKCLVDPPQIAAAANGIPGTTMIECGVPGAEVGDLVLATLYAYDTGGATAYATLLPPRCRIVNANRMVCKIQSSNTSIWNPATLQIDYLVLQ